MAKKKHEVWFAWGEEAVKAWREDPKRQQPFLSHYKFDTREELNAFLEGVIEALGVVECEQIDELPT
jgi:hypothetical protein